MGNNELNHLRGHAEDSVYRAQQVTGGLNIIQKAGNMTVSQEVEMAGALASLAQAEATLYLAEVLRDSLERMGLVIEMSGRPPHFTPVSSLRGNNG